MLESLFNKVTGFIKKRLQHSFFPVNIAKFLRSSLKTPLMAASVSRSHFILLRNLFQWIPILVALGCFRRSRAF